MLKDIGMFLIITRNKLYTKFACELTQNHTWSGLADLLNKTAKYLIQSFVFLLALCFHDAINDDI